MRTPTAPPGRRRATRVAALAAGVAAVSSACAGDFGAGGVTDRPGETIATGYMPSEPGITDETGMIISLWNGSWIAAILIVALIWGLVIWSVVAYRRRKGDNALPVQLRYHVPLELMYTIIPVLIVGVLFYYTVGSTATINDESAEPDLRIEVYGKQWSWDFNYLDEDVYSVGVPAWQEYRDSETGLPTLYLPVDQTVQFELRSRDVQHSFWIPAFLYKLDVYPGVTNTFQVTPQREGLYQGKCAELCGEFHSDMLFNVAVVDQATYDAYMAELRAAGQVGRLGEAYSRLHNTEGTRE